MEAELPALDLEVQVAEDKTATFSHAEGGDLRLEAHTFCSEYVAEDKVPVCAHHLVQGAACKRRSSSRPPGTRAARRRQTRVGRVQVAASRRPGGAQGRRGTGAGGAAQGASSGAAAGRGAGQDRAKADQVRVRAPSQTSGRRRTGRG